MDHGGSHRGRQTPHERNRNRARATDQSAACQYLPALCARRMVRGRGEAPLEGGSARDPVCRRRHLVFSAQGGRGKSVECLIEAVCEIRLTLHPEKTRLIEFGRDAGRNAKRQGKKPPTFDFLGFTHMCARSRKGKFTVHVKTIGKRLRRGLKAITEWCQKHRHEPVDAQQKTLNAKLRGHYQYYGRPTNGHSLRQFYRSVRRIWKQWLSRPPRGR